MKIFQYNGSDADKYWCPYIPEGQSHISLYLGYKSLLKEWKPWKLNINKSNYRQYTDFPNLIPGSITISQKAYLALSSILDNHPNLEILPCESEDGPFYLLNIWNEVDCFDRVNSIYTPDNGNPDFIGTIKSYSLHAQEIQQNHIFRIPEAMSAIFVSDLFVKLVHENNLIGLDLVDPIWTE